MAIKTERVALTIVSIHQSCPHTVGWTGSAGHDGWLHTTRWFTCSNHRAIWFNCPKAVTYPTTGQAQCWVTSMIETNAYHHAKLPPNYWKYTSNELPRINSPLSSVPNSFNRSVKLSRISMRPWAGITICDLIIEVVIVIDTCTGNQPADAGYFSTHKTNNNMYATCHKSRCQS